VPRVVVARSGALRRNFTACVRPPAARPVHSAATRQS
jgi:hypothetical protein